ncbi:MAG TPA: hypothetical protein VGZ48_09820 [Candidatus Acidoferrales bacterium]|nr:hypothetical protein [Candidatus Acidoferrales bacterium]
MKRTPTICAVLMLVSTLSVASAGIFACQIDCALTPAAPPMSHAGGGCGSHAGMPLHTPGNDKGGHQHAGHSHSRIIAATHGSSVRISLQQIGNLAHVAGGAVLTADANSTLWGELAAAKSPSLIFTSPVLRI